MGHVQVVTFDSRNRYTCAGLTPHMYSDSESQKLQPEDGPHAGPKHVVVSLRH